MTQPDPRDQRLLDILTAETRSCRTPSVSDLSHLCGQEQRETAAALHRLAGLGLATRHATKVGSGGLMVEAFVSWTAAGVKPDPTAATARALDEAKRAHDAAMLAALQPLTPGVDWLAIGDGLTAEIGEDRHDLTVERDVHGWAMWLDLEMVPPGVARFGSLPDLIAAARAYAEREVETCPGPAVGCDDCAAARAFLSATCIPPDAPT